MKTKRAVGGVLLLLSAAAALLLLWYMAYGGRHDLLRALLSLLFAGALFVAGLTVSLSALPDEAAKAQFSRRVQWVAFSLYLLSLSVALFVLRIDFANYAADRLQYFRNLRLYTNFVPLRTVRLYLRCLKYGYIGTRIPLSNLMGNLLLFAPMAVLLPALFNSTQKFWRYLLLMFAILTAVEALQLVLGCGSCDIDDVILNLGGTVLVYWLCRVPPVARLLCRLRLR